MENLTMTELLEVVGLCLTALTLIVTIFLAYKGYAWAQRNWLKQKQIENQNNLLKTKYDTKVQAYKGAWRVLSYLSDRDNPKGMFEVYEENGSNNYYLYPDRAEAFFAELEAVFYTEGHGLFWPKDVRKTFFHLRSRIGSILYNNEKKENADGLLLVNTNLEKYFKKTHEELIIRVRELVQEERME